MNSDAVPRGETAAAPRRHDFDALRAFAMMLGIALHAGLAFAPIPWLVMNSDTSSAIGTFIEVLHGFRLPLFFLMSGYFSAMLLQRRGTAGFLTHRGKRIALPLLLGSVTIIPITWGVLLGGHALLRAVPAEPREWSTPAGDDATIWRAAANGNLDTVKGLVLTGTPVDQPDPQFFTLPLAWAATGDHADVVAFMLEHGANPNQRMGDDNTPVYTACFFGASDSLALLLEAGGDLSTQNAHGETPIDAMQHDAAVVGFISSLLDVDVEFDRVQAGRTEIELMLAAVAVTPPARRLIRDRVAGLLTGELLMHLWFLWHLCWLAVGLVVGRLLLRLLAWNTLPDGIVSSPLCLLGLIPLTALTQSWQKHFGADTSTSLIPAWHVLLHYAVFFAFGALMHRSPRAADRLGRTWWLYTSVSVASCFLALQLMHDPTFAVGVRLDEHTRAWLVAAMQSVFVWTSLFGLIGLARRVLSRPRPWVRYASDSAYWLYIAHLPLAIGGQFAFAYVPFHPILEFMLLTAATTLVLLASYQLCIRHTWLGLLLNGTRR